MMKANCNRIEQLLYCDSKVKENRQFIDDNTNCTYLQFMQSIDQLKELLDECNIRPLDRVVILSENGIPFITAFFSILSCQAIAVPVDPSYPDNRIMELLEILDARFVLISGTRPNDFYKTFKNADNKNLTILIAQDEKWLIQKKSSVKKQNINQDKYLAKDDFPAVILFTSGTTGNSKGALLSHKSIINNINAVLQLNLYQSDETFIISKTLCHVSTLVCEILTGIRIGANIIVKNPIVSPRVILSRIENHRATCLFVNPSILRLLLTSRKSSYNLSSLKLIITSGACVDKNTLSDAESFFYNASVLNAYGLTEAGPRVSIQRATDSKKDNSVGKPLNGIKIYIKDDKETTLPLNEVGNIVIDTPGLMMEYWNDNRSTKMKIRDGLLYSGDIGYIDENSELFILGRSDDIINRGSHKINLNDVEKIINNIEGVEDCILFGIPDALHGNKIVCVFSKTIGHTITTNQIFDYCKNYLAAFEIPQIINEWDALPMTLNGKKSRQLIIKEYYRIHANKEILN